MNMIMGKNTFAFGENAGGNNNMLVVGASGSGKTESAIKPNLLHLLGQTNFAVADVKGQLEKEFKRLYLRHGYRAQSVDLINPQESELGYNPLDYVNSEQDVIALAHRLVYASHNRETSKTDPFWNLMAELLLSAMIGAVIAHEDEKMQTLDRVMKYVSEVTVGEGPIDIILRMIESEYGSDHFAVRQYRKLRQLCGAERTFACVVASLQSVLARYDTEDMRLFFHKKNKIDFSAFTTASKNILFVKTSDTDEVLYPLANILFGQMIDLLCHQADATKVGRLPIPLQFIMDDFGTMVKLDNMGRISSTVRSRNISLLLVCQSIQQLTEGYEKEGQTIISNCDQLCFFGINDIPTAKELSERLDKPVVDILNQKRDKVTLIRAGHAPVIDDRYDYRTHPRYAELQAASQKRFIMPVIEHE